MYVVLFVTLLAAGSYGQRRIVEEWEVEESSSYPDPQTDPRGCGRYAGKPAYVCDPNGILSSKGADILDWLLAGVYKNETKCPCSALRCETMNSGTYIQVAVAKKLKADGTDENSKVAAAEKFAYMIEGRTSKECDNDLVIVYSAEDQTIFSVAGTTTTRVLSQNLMKKITDEHLVHFKDEPDLTAGLYSLIVDYRNVLKGIYQSRRDNDLSQRAMNGAGQITSTIFMLAISCLLALWR